MIKAIEVNTLQFGALFEVGQRRRVLYYHCEDMQLCHSIERDGNCYKILTDKQTFTVPERDVVYIDESDKVACEVA